MPRPEQEAEATWRWPSATWPTRTLRALDRLAAYVQTQQERTTVAWIHAEAAVGAALRLLHQMGHRAEQATRGIEAIECLERQPCEVVLIDVQMTDMDGLEASRINERWRNGGRTRIISMIANATQRNRGECLAAGMEDHVNKPNRVDHLIASLVRT